jgi:hypothetical protein
MRGRRRSRSRVGFGALVAALAVVLAACGGGDSGNVRKSLVPAGTRPSRLDLSVTEPRPGQPRYRAQKTVRGGLVLIRFRNLGKTARKAQLWRVGAGHSVAQALRTRHRRLAWAGGVGLTRPRARGRRCSASLPAATT